MKKQQTNANNQPQTKNEEKLIAHDTATQTTTAQAATLIAEPPRPSWLKKSKAKRKSRNGTKNSAIVSSKGSRRSSTRPKPSNKVVSQITPQEPPLNEEEQEELKRCEGIIKKDWKTFLEVGKALITIRDKKLYRVGHKTFENYCRTRWGYERSYGHRLMNSANVVHILWPIGNIPSGLNEAQIRPLVGLNDTEIRQVWEKVTKEHPNGTRTASIVQKCAHELFPKAKKPASKGGDPDRVKEIPSLLEKLVGFAQATNKQSANSVKDEILEILRGQLK